MTALKAGEDRAILLGLAMVTASIMMYFVVGITILRSYADRYCTINLTVDHFFVYFVILVNSAVANSQRLQFNQPVFVAFMQYVCLSVFVV